MINTDYIVSDYITFINFVTLVACITKDNAKFYPEIYLEEAFFNKYVQHKALKKT